MKKRSHIAFTCLLMIMAMLYASGAANRSNQLVQGTIVEVRKLRTQSPEYGAAGSNPVDAPPTTHYYTFEVSIRVGCETYVGHYNTPFNYLPAAFESGQQIQMRLIKHAMYFDLPNDPDMRMGIVRRHSVCGPSRDRVGKSVGRTCARG
jgi:hypothetical protein